MEDKTYIGDELPIFSNALNWKDYWSSLIELNSLVVSAVEVGAGIGSNVQFLFQKSKYLYLLEPDALFCQDYLYPYSQKYDSIIVVNGKINDLSEGVSLDHIYYIDVLEHIERDELELKNATSKLNINGSIFILVPAHQFLFSEFDRSVGHFRRYTVKDFSKIIPVGYKIVSAKYLDTLGFCLSVMLKVFPASIFPTERNIHFWDKYLVPITKRLDKLLGYKIGKSLLLEIKSSAHDL